MQTHAAESADDRSLRDCLVAGISGVAERVVVGLNWTLVAGRDGAGLAQTPARGTAGCRSLPQPGSYRGQPLAALAALWQSENVFEHAIAVAAVNAHWNRFDLEGGSQNGIDLIENRGERTVVIGRFPRLAEQYPGIAVVEREPRPGEYPESALATLLPKAEFVAVTASTIVNGSLPRILALSRHAYVLMIGPSTPLSPALFQLGLGALSGFVAKDVERLAETVIEGGTVAALRPFGRFATIERSGRH